LQITTNNQTYEPDHLDTQMAGAKDRPA